MYQAPITHKQRTALIIAIDCSTSMQGMTRINSTAISKCTVASMVCNQLIDELVMRATRNGKVRNYYDIAVIGYSGHAIDSLLPNGCNGLTPISILAGQNPQPKTIFIDQITPRGDVTSVPIFHHQWVNSYAQGSTPMYEAMVTVYDMVSDWCALPENKGSFPPIVFNISDGSCSDSSDSALQSIAEDITSTRTNDGNTLLINIHLSSLEDEHSPELFPTDKNFYSHDPDRRRLFMMSSILPAEMEHLIANMTTSSEPGPYRAVAFDTSISELLSILNIGSESINTKRVNKPY